MKLTHRLVTALELALSQLNPMNWKWKPSLSSIGEAYARAL